MDVFDTLDAPPKPDVFDELDAPKADVFDEVAAPVVSPPKESAVLSGSLSGSTPVPETPTLSEDDPRFPEVAAGVLSSQAVLDQFLLPAKIDAFKLLSNTEREQQALDARVVGIEAERELQNLPPDAPLNVFQEVRQRAIDARIRGEAMQQRTDAALPLNDFQQRLANQEKAAMEKKAFTEKLNTEGDVPGFLGTLMSKLTSSAAGAGAEIARDISPSIGTGAFEYLNEIAGNAEEMTQLNQGVTGKLGRGVAVPTFLMAGNPAGTLGLVTATLKGAMDTRNQVFRQTGSRVEADKAAIDTYPMLALYIGTGFAAAKGAAAMVPANASPAIKGLTGFAGAEIANVGTSAAVRIAEGQDYGLEELTADTLMALVQARGEYKGAVSERAQKRAEAELLSRGFSEQQIQQPFDFKGETPASRVLPAPEKVDPFTTNEKITSDRSESITGREPESVIAAQDQMVVDANEPSSVTKEVPTEPAPEIERNLGPGAANIEEFGEGVKVGAYNAKVDEQRAQRGLEPLMSEARKTDETTWQNVENRVEADAEWPRRVVDDINAGQKKGVTDEEQAGLLWRMIDLRNKRDEADVRAIDENTYSPEERAEFETQAKDFERQLQETELADRKAGTQQGRALRIRRLLAYEDFTLAGMERRAREAKGDALTPQERGELGTLATKAEQAKKTLEEREYAVESGIDESIREIERKAMKNPEFTPEVRGLADRIVTKLEKAAKGASERLKALMSQIGSQFGSAPDVAIVAKIVKEMTVLAASEIGRVGLKSTLKFTRWAADMVSRFGDGVKPYLDRAWKQADAAIDAEVAGTRTKKPKEVKAAITKEKTAETVDSIGAAMKAKGGKLPALRGDIQKLVEALVRGGVTRGKDVAQGRSDLVDAVHDVLKGIDPKITRREAMDAISDYGRFKPLNKDAIKAEVRDLRQQLQQVGKMEDILAGDPLKKTGIERQPPSDEGRALIKQVNELARIHGVKVTDPTVQLKTILAAIETRLTNRIKDLKAEIAKGERAVKTKTAAPSNDRVEALRAELGAVEKQHEAVFGKQGMTDEQRIRALKTRTTKRIDELEQRMKAEDFGPRPKRKPLDISRDPEAVKAKADLERVKGEFETKKAKWERARRSAGRKFFDFVGDFVGASRSLKTSFDISAPFRQGGFLSIGDLVFAPRKFTIQFRKMLGTLASPKKFDELQASFQLRPNAELYEQSGLYLADVGTKMTNREENMRSNLAELVPGVKASNRAYVALLNQQRADTFDSFVSMMGGKDAITPEQAKFMAKAVNDLTGRGDLKPQYAGAANFLAKYLFSPRFLLSRIKTVLGVPIFRGLLTGEKVGFKARAIVAAQYAKFATGLAAVYGLSKLAGAIIEDDPRSSDFGKMRFGKTRVDPMAGLQQVGTFLSRVLSRSVVDGRGRERPLTGTTLGNFARSKLAPIPGTSVDVALGRNVVGLEVTPQSAAVGLVAPLSVPAEIEAIYEEQGPVKATVLQLLNLMGAGLSHY